MSEAQISLLLKNYDLVTKRFNFSLNATLSISSNSSGMSHFNTLRSCSLKKKKKKRQLDGQQLFLSSLPAELQT